LEEPGNWLDWSQALGYSREESRVRTAPGQLPVLVLPTTLWLWLGRVSRSLA